MASGDMSEMFGAPDDSAAASSQRCHVFVLQGGVWLRESRHCRPPSSKTSARQVQGAWAQRALP
eukprot:6627321-Prymnesium_polylepis.1